MINRIGKMCRIFSKTVDICRILLYSMGDEFNFEVHRMFCRRFVASLNIPVVTDEGTRPSGGVLTAAFFIFFKVDS